MTTTSRMTDLTHCWRRVYALDRRNDGTAWDYFGNPPFDAKRIHHLAQVSLCNRCSQQSGPRCYTKGGKFAHRAQS